MLINALLDLRWVALFKTGHDGIRHLSQDTKSRDPLELSEKSCIGRKIVQNLLQVVDHERNDQKGKKDRD